MVDIDELERLLAAATPGEWVACGWGDGSTPDGVTNIFNHDAEVLLMECLPIDDAALIVAARNSLPALLTEIRELRAENARLREDVRRQTSLAQDHFRNATRLAARVALGEPQ